jgi:plastocyanin
MKKLVIVSLLIICIGAILAAGCTSTETINTTPNPTVTLQTPQITPVDTTPPLLTTSIPIAVTTVPTTEQPNETALASMLTISGDGANFVSNATHYVPAYGGPNIAYNQYDTGTAYIYGSVDSRSKYNLKVDVEVDIDGIALYDSIIVPTFGTGGFKVSLPYVVTGGSSSVPYNVYISNVSIVSMNTSETIVPIPPPTIPVVGSSYTIQITSTGFIPQYDVVRTGANINWVNNDTVPHAIAMSWNVTSMFYPSTIMPGGASQITSFKEPGIYTYTSSDNQNITGSICVG